jgi:hypothetical protein
VRRADSNRPGDLYRLWEVAGASHAGGIPGCDGPPSTFPTDAFVRGAVVALTSWAEHRLPPHRATRIALATSGIVSAVRVDQYGNATGGVRSPFVDVPIARYDAHSTPGPICELSGRETPLSQEQLSRRYRNEQSYLLRFKARLGAAIVRGYLLEQDGAAILAAQQAKADSLLANVVRS